MEHTNPDFLDNATELAQEQVDDAVDKVRRAAAKIEPGGPGFCDICGNHFPRVVNRTSVDGGTFQACGRCRDELKIG